ncbi:hypothetical protein EVAR_79311_1 [Eumeta japonica]|uniref:Uncharacterized protein n=1 Tax=Eumeta variegata TaxID=151549 RepID=A0A4C1TEK6_EUMVA|nr:hypothetical protein EVAR_79311_1 [Eumeta japonica]
MLVQSDKKPLSILAYRDEVRSSTLSLAQRALGLIVFVYQRVRRPNFTIAEHLHQLGEIEGVIYGKSRNQYRPEGALICKQVAGYANSDEVASALTSNREVPRSTLTTLELYDEVSTSVKLKPLSARLGQQIKPSGPGRRHRVNDDGRHQLPVRGGPAPTALAVRDHRPNMKRLRKDASQRRDDEQTTYIRV